MNFVLDSNRDINEDLDHGKLLYQISGTTEGSWQIRGPDIEYTAFTDQGLWSLLPSRQVCAAQHAINVKREDCAGAMNRSHDSLTA